MSPTATPRSSSCERRAWRAARAFRKKSAAASSVASESPGGTARSCGGPCSPSSFGLARRMADIESAVDVRARFAGGMRIERRGLPGSEPQGSKEAQFAAARLLHALHSWLAVCKRSAAVRPPLRRKRGVKNSALPPLLQLMVVVRRVLGVQIHQPGPPRDQEEAREREERRAVLRFGYSSASSLVLASNASTASASPSAASTGCIPVSRTGRLGRRLSAPGRRSSSSARATRTAGRAAGQSRRPHRAGWTARARRRAARRSRRLRHLTKELVAPLRARVRDLQRGNPPAALIVSSREMSDGASSAQCSAAFEKTKSKDSLSFASREVGLEAHVFVELKRVAARRQHISRVVDAQNGRVGPRLSQQPSARRAAARRGDRGFLPSSATRNQVGRRLRLGSPKARYAAGFHFAVAAVPSWLRRLRPRCRCSPPKCRL